MGMPEPHFNLPLNLPHAATIAHRILHHMRGRGAPPEALERVGGLVVLLEPWRDEEDNGPVEAAEKWRQSAAALGRGVVDDIEKCGVGYDGVGRAVGNVLEGRA